jgi:WD40 repeat protein
MRGHTNYIETFDLYKHSLATGAADNTYALQPSLFHFHFLTSISFCSIKLWKVTGTAPVHTLEGHTAGVNALKFNEVHMVSGSADNTARIWDTTIGVCTHTLAHQVRTYPYTISNNFPLTKYVLGCRKRDRIRLVDRCHR